MLCRHLEDGNQFNLMEKPGNNSGFFVSKFWGFGFLDKIYVNQKREIEMLDVRSLQNSWDEQEDVRNGVLPYWSELHEGRCLEFALELANQQIELLTNSCKELIDAAESAAGYGDAGIALGAARRISLELFNK